MSQKTYTIPKQKILIVEKKRSMASVALKNYLGKYDSDMYFSPVPPSTLDKFDLCYIINERGTDILRHHGPWKKVIFIFTHLPEKHATQFVHELQKKSITNVKVISVSSHDITKPLVLEQVIWFSLSSSHEKFLLIPASPLPKSANLPKAPSKKIKKPLSLILLSFFEHHLGKKQIVLAAASCFLIYHLLFVFPLILGSYYMLQAKNTFKSRGMDVTLSYLDKGKEMIGKSKQLYASVRPSYLFFSLAALPDDVFAISDHFFETVSLIQSSKNIGRDFFILFFQKNKTPVEKQKEIASIKALKDNLQKIEDNLTFINQKLPSRIPFLSPYKNTLSQVSYILAKSKKLMPFTDNLLGANSERRYLLLFANNMELRPGGGFIGSYGIITIADFTLKNIQIYDVYDADGQLTAHIDPPDPIRKYLNQPHWFLRDSAFSPDFYDNYFQAKFFLEKEKQLSNFYGGVIITTDAIKNIIGAFDDLFLPDFNEKITKDNFYIKAQLYAEKDFFPGSTQKKSFLYALTRQILSNLDLVSPEKLLQALYDSLEEKQMAVFLEDEPVQKTIDSLYWAGRIIQPQCPPTSDNCYADYMFPYDANLGVNKANFFINRAMETKIFIDDDGIIHSYLNIKYKNESLQEIFPGGAYHNYLTFLIPRDSMINTITVDNIPLHSYDQDTGQFKRIGFLIDIPVQTQKEVSIEYQSLKSFKKGRAVYQLLFQKQIGSINNDFSLTITLPSNVFLVNQNFSPLVKNNQIIYNTELSADKIFFIELLKE